MFALWLQFFICKTGGAENELATGGCIPDSTPGDLPVLSYLPNDDPAKEIWFAFYRGGKFKFRRVKTCPRSPACAVSFSLLVWSVVHALGNTSLILPGCPYTEVGDFKINEGFPFLGVTVCIGPPGIMCKNMWVCPRVHFLESWSSSDSEPSIRIIKQ